MYTEVSKLNMKGRSSNVIFVGEKTTEIGDMRRAANMQFSTSSPATDPRVSRMLVAYSPHEINLIVWPWVNVKLMNEMQNNNSMCVIAPWYQSLSVKEFTSTSLWEPHDPPRNNQYFTLCWFWHRPGISGASWWQLILCWCVAQRQVAFNVF